MIPGALHQQLTAELRGRRSTGFGLLMEEVDGRLFVRNMFAGGPGESAGLQRGDEILSIDAEKPLLSASLISAGYDPGEGINAMYFFQPGVDRTIQLDVQSDRRGRTRR